MTTRLETIRGVLLGGAVGDALGAPVEFMRRSEILKLCGADGVRRYLPAYGRIGAITDDTQMTLFTLEGIIRGEIRFSAKGICNRIAVIDHAYRRWYATQVSSLPDKELDGWLIKVPALWSQRAPGNTCLSAIRAKLNKRLGERARNDSKGAGAVMRVAPVGLFARDAFQVGCETAALTHGHPTAINAAGWFAHWIWAIASGEDFRSAARDAQLRCKGGSAELDAALDLAFLLQAAPMAEGVPRELGEGWIAEEACSIALWSVLATDDPFQAMRLAVTIDGDSDTTGTLVGHALGAAFETAWIPDHLLKGLELREEMESLAIDAHYVLGDSFAGEDDPRFDRLWERYPGW